MSRPRPPCSRVAFVCFACGWIGGGDAKLAAATALWLGFGNLFSYLVYASLLGGALTLLIVQFRTMPLPRLLAGREWAERLHSQGAGVPYGVALAAAALLGLSADRMDDGRRPVSSARSETLIARPAHATARVNATLTRFGYASLTMP